MLQSIDAPCTQLPSAVRRPDGRPRYSLAIPMLALSDPRRFGDFQAERTDGGLDPEIRAFLDDALRDGDTYVDVGAGWGVQAFGAATAPGRRVKVLCLVEGAEEAALLARNAEANSLRAQIDVEVVDSLADAPVDALLDGRLLGEQGRVFMRVADGSHLPGVLARCAALLAGGRLAAVLWPRRPDAAGQESLADRIVLQTLEAFGYSRLTLVEDDQGPMLVPLESASGARLVISLSPSALEEQEPPDPRVVRVLEVARGPDAASAGGLPLVAIDCSTPAWGEPWLASLDLALRLQESGVARPILLGEPDLRAFGEDGLRRLLPALELGRELTRAIVESAEPLTMDCPVFLWVGEGLEPLGSLGERLRGSRNVALVHLTDPALDAGASERARAFDHLLTGSARAADALRDHGIADVSQIPAATGGGRPLEPRKGWFANRFVILSAGPLSYAGGHDRVVAAFRELHRRHPEALLVAAWHNPDPESMGDLARDGLVTGRPGMNAFGELEVRPWLIANGIAPEAVIDPGPHAFARLDELLREADVAVFADRFASGWSTAPARGARMEVPALLCADAGHVALLDELERHILDRPDEPTAL